MSSNEIDALLRSFGSAKPQGVPSSVVERIEDTLHRLPARSELARRSQRIRRLAMAVASMAIIGGAVASYAVFSKEQPLGSSDIARISSNNPIVQPADYIRRPILGSLLDDSSMDKNGPVVTDHGITFMLRDVIYDGAEMEIRYSVRSDKEIDDYMLDANITMDGRDAGKVGYVSAEEPGNLQHRFEKSGPGQYEGAIRTWKLSYSGYRPASFHFKIETTKIGNQAGNWSLDIPVAKTENMTVIFSDLKKTAEEGTIAMKRIVLSPVSTQVSYRFEEGKLDRTSWFGVAVMGDDGTFYGGQSGNSTSSLGYMDIGPVASGTQALLIRPYYEDYRNTMHIENKDLFHTEMLKQPTAEDPLNLPLGEGRELSVTSIEYLADRTVIHSDSVLVGGSYAVQDEQGKMLLPLTFGSDGSIEFKPISKDAKLTFLTRPTYPPRFIPELELRVDIPELQADSPQP
ncbi:DUF4179 domain-containing protein [Cohnella terricola]|uniref:DUF4179 domain-containing protein n=1 Tax=Cohnella terricola TaxID=1289167 RepID=A0A559JBU6_9BACL|nr:DUF4179 domain-containing protein [Cohnella terricola]TVX97358.1 DUF4179 domain-containing protein [Cohnella terricola]